MKKTRKKKDINVVIDTKNVDIVIKRKDGKLDVEIDTPIIDAELHKDEQETKVKVKADDNILNAVRNFRQRKSSYK